MMDYIFSAMPAFKALLIMPVMTFVITYSISISMDLMTYPNYYLSSSIKYSPASSIGTLGLALTTVLIPFISFIRHEHVKYHIENNDNNRILTTKMNNRSLTMSCVAGLSALGVASFQDVMSTEDIHLSFALLFFMSGLAYGRLSHKLDKLLPGLGTPNERLVRKSLWYCSAVHLGLYPLFIFLSLTDPRDVLVFTLSISEIIFFVNILSFYATFYREMKTVSIRFGIDSESLLDTCRI